MGWPLRFHRQAPVAVPWDHGEMGREAGRMLLARIERPDAPRETRLAPPRLEVRGSTGPAPT